MLTVIGCMFAGVAAGYLLRRHTYRQVDRIITGLIRLLLLLLGWEVGSNDGLIASLPTLGWEAWLLATSAVVGSCLAARGLMGWIDGKQPSPAHTPATALAAESGATDTPLPNDSTPSAPAPSTEGHSLADGESGETGLGGSLIILGFFAAGVAGGLLPGAAQALPAVNLASRLALCLLMGCVGFGVGNRPDTLRDFRQLNPRLALLPLTTIAGTLVGCAAAALLLRHTVSECMAVGAGLGYYSLSSILITDARGAELGTIALLSNILRELYALLAAPLLVRLWGRLAPIAAGGATTADTTLPIITRYGGRELTPVAIYHGLLTDLSVPFLVMLFTGW